MLIEKYANIVEISLFIKENVKRRFVPVYLQYDLVQCLNVIL